MVGSCCFRLVTEGLQSDVSLVVVALRLGGTERWASVFSLPAIASSVVVVDVVVGRNDDGGRPRRVGSDSESAVPADFLSDGSLSDACGTNG